MCAYSQAYAVCACVWKRAFSIPIKSVWIILNFSSNNRERWRDFKSGDKRVRTDANRLWSIFPSFSGIWVNYVFIGTEVAHLPSKRKPIKPEKKENPNAEQIQWAHNIEWSKLNRVDYRNRSAYDYFMLYKYFAPHFITFYYNNISSSSIVDLKSYRIAYVRLDSGLIYLPRCCYDEPLH